MPERATLKRLEDFALPLGERDPRGIWFARLCGWSEDAKAGLWRVHELARRRGVIIEERLINPDEGQIASLTRVIGADFQPTAACAEAALARWMPDMSAAARRAFGEALEAHYRELTAQGKPVGVLKNLFAKLLCWLNYRFGRMVPLLEGEQPPKVLYAGAGITAHELIMLHLLWAIGADVLLVLTGGEAAYLKQDPDSRWSQRFVSEGEGPFPTDFSLRGLRDVMRAAEAPRSAATPKAQARPTPTFGAERPAPAAPTRRFREPERELCTNEWMAEPDYRQILTPPARRGGDPKRFYNACVRLNGVRDRGEYVGELYRFYQSLSAAGRAVVAVDGPMPAPEPEEIARIRRRGRYDTPEEMIADLAGNLPVQARDELLRQMQRAFARVLEDAAGRQDNLRKLTVSAVYLLCRIKRYYDGLFHGWRETDVPVFILMGGCRNADEALFVRWLSMLPADVLLLAPDLNRPCALEDGRFLDLREDESMPTPPFPRDDAALRMSTLAAHAERDLDSLLYSDSGLFRERQFARASAITLRTTYDELFILWNQELKYRQGFSTDNDAVTMPVLFAKISGVEKGDMAAYWRRVRELTEGDVYYVSQMPMLPAAGGNPCQALALNYLRNGRLNRTGLKADPRYPFALLRPAVQDHILDKLQLMLDGRLIQGTFVNGTEYAVVATVLNLDTALARALQGFDFTRRNPKVVCVSTREARASLEDAILLTFLNLAGFDVALFVPTGYQSIERYRTDGLPVEHQIGPYMYDQIVPDLSALPQEKGPSWFGRLFRREN